jgi:hypothetical protein
MKILTTILLGFMLFIRQKSFGMEGVYLQISEPAYERALVSFQDDLTLNQAFTQAQAIEIMDAIMDGGKNDSKAFHLHSESYGVTPLMFALYKKHDLIALMLIERILNLNCDKNKLGQTVLMIGVINDCCENLFLKMIKKGASPYIKDIKGETIFNYKNDEYLPLLDFEKEEILKEEALMKAKNKKHSEYQGDSEDFS